MPHKGKDMRLLSVTDCSPAPGPVQAPISFAICWLPSLHIIRDEKCRLARLAKCIFNGVRVVCNYCQENTGWSVRLRSALLPVSYGGRGEPEACGKLRLA